MTEFIAILITVILTIFLIRSIGAWMLRINTVIFELRCIKQFLEVIIAMKNRERDEKLNETK